jgi:hypothetical protein
VIFYHFDFYIDNFEIRNFYILLKRVVVMPIFGKEIPESQICIIRGKLQNTMC